MRLFLALELPGSLRAVLARIQEEVRPQCPGWRFLAPEGIHLTLRFLGEIDDERDAELRESWARAVGPFSPVRFSLDGIGVFPSPSRPRVLWAGLREQGSEGNLAGVALALEATARAAGFAAESRDFHPHLTLARARPGERPRAPAAVVSEPGPTVECAEVVLFRSDLGRSGARYTRLDAFPLLAPAGGRVYPAGP